MTHPPTRRRTLAVLALLAAASVALSGCLYSLIPEGAPISDESLAPDTSGVPADLLPFYEQTLDWELCHETLQCAEVTAPLDWEDPGKGEIELAIVRQRALSGDPVGSLLTNPGGPGSSGYDFVVDSVTVAYGDALQQAYDIVGFDPRGVNNSTAVRCYDATGMDSFLFDIPEGSRGSAAWNDEVSASNEAFAEACDAGSEGILPYITTVNAARDLDLLRAVLGDEKLDYLGFSYGTFLGATYADLFPERVGRLVLDGAVDPTISRLELGVVQAIGFESALRAYMAWCLAGDECPFRGSVDEAMSDVGALMASVDRSPLPAADGRMLGADSLRTAIVLPLYSEANWPALNDVFSETLAGAPEFAFYVADLYYSREDGVYLDNSTEAFLTYNCMDFPMDWSQADEDAAAERIAEEAPNTGPDTDSPDLCSVWSYPPTGVREPLTAEGAAPIVVVGTTNDPATPYEWSVALADQLASGVLVTRVGEGHTGYLKGNDCVDRAVEDYLLKGTVPEDGLRCE